jgi:glycine/sarcosine N-methyltransferase
MIDRYRGLAPFYDIFVDWEKRLNGEMPFLLEECGASSKATCSVLDIGCGPGHHLAAFMRAGCMTEGLEPSPFLRKLARTNANGALIHRNGMASLGRLACKRGPWDFLICLGNTVAHLNPSGLNTFLSDLASAAKPEGKAVLHLLNYQKIMRTKPGGLPDKQVLYEGSTWRFVRSYRYRKKSLDFSLEVFREGYKISENLETLYPITAHHLKTGAAAAGFKNIRCLGAFDRNMPFSESSDDLVVLLSF